MPAARLSSIPWFIRDWFLSRSRSKLEPDQRMAFCEILWLMYLSEDGYVENDLAYLQSITGLTSDRIAPAMRLLNPGNATHFTHPKVQQALEAIRRESERNREFANRRWRNKKTSGGNAPAMPDQCARNAILKPEASGYAPAPAPSGGRRGANVVGQKPATPPPDLTPLPKWNGPPRRPPLPDPPPREPNENDRIAAKLMAELENRFPSEREDQDPPTEEP